jgi:thiol-disulfide isomerase/thioredoxin/uncharacterized membrane protein YphA (DoxX/SURF4 family)
VLDIAPHRGKRRLHEVIDLGRVHADGARHPEGLERVDGFLGHYADVDYLVLSLRLGLALLFTVAAAGKLLNRPGTIGSLVSFGVPRRGAGWAAGLVPTIESAVAIGLLVDPVSRGAALAATLLLLVFSTAAGRARVAGLAPSCNCFGQAQAQAIDAGFFARNALLAAAALTCLLAPASVAPPPWSLPVAIGAGVATAAAGHLQRRRGRLRQGAAAPGWLAPSLSVDRPTAIVFVAADCGPCSAVVPKLDRWKDALAESMSVVALDVAHLPTATGVSATPSAVFVAADGTVESGLARGPLGVEALIRARAAGLTHART